MFIDIQELERHPLDFQEEIRPNVLDLGPEVRQNSPLTARGHADLVEEHHGKHQVIKDIRVTGALSTRLEISCARCLEPVEQEVARSFNLLYRPQGIDARSDELSITDVEAEVGYYRGEGLQLEDVLQEQILLALPLKTICTEYCRGLCPHCGKNLNREQCSCAEPVEDARWSALKNIRKKLEH